jgi:hypothetical protein
MKLVFLFTLPVMACSPAYVPGRYVDTLSQVHEGFIRFTPCFDVHKDTAAGITFKGNNGGKSHFVLVSSIERVMVGADSFIALRKGQISAADRRGVDHDLFARIVESGPLMLLAFCEIDHQATMIKVKRMEIERYLIRQQGDPTFEIVPHTPADFIGLMEKQISDDSLLLREIRTANYVQKIANPKPGCITQYEAVTRQQVREWVEKYNSRKQGR